MIMYTLAEVVENLKVSDNTVRRAIDKGDLHAYKIGKLWRISEDQLNNYLAKRTVSNLKRKKATLA